MGTEPKFLIIRSARDNVLAYAARTIRARHPGAELAVLCQPAHRARAAALAAPAEVVEYPAARFTPDGLPPGLRARLAGAGFTGVVVLYHNPDGQGYAPVHAMVRRFHRDPVTVINSDGRWSPHRSALISRQAAGIALAAGALGGAVAALAYALFRCRRQ